MYRYIRVITVVMLVILIIDTADAKTKKFKQELYGTWRKKMTTVHLVSDEEYYENNFIFIFRFNRNGTGYFKTISDGLRTIRTNKIPDLTVINIPFKYTVEKTEGENKVVIEYDKGKVLYRSEMKINSEKDSIKNAQLIELGKRYIEGRVYLIQTLYWMILPDENNYNKKSFVYLNKDRKYQYYEKKPKRYDIWKYD